MRWYIKTVTTLGPEGTAGWDDLEGWLADGWEPFAVQCGSHPRYREGVTIYFLRKQSSTLVR